MSEYIERAAFVGALTAAEAQKALRNMTGADAYFAALKMVNELPAADVAPVRHGRWIEKENWGMDDYFYTCSVCGEDFAPVEGTPSDNLWNYCPNCGAKMDGPEQ